MLVTKMLITETKMQEIDERSFESHAKEGSVLVEFFTDWCTVCRQMEPTLQSFSKSFSGVKFFKVNAGKNINLASKFSVMSVPTFIFVKNGKLVDQVVGYLNPGQLKQKIEQRLS
jgi:thioredoxin 1